MKRISAFFALSLGLALLPAAGQGGRPKASFADGVLTVGDVRYEFARVPAGKFQMGSENRYNNEKPLHAVRLDAFLMGRTEVTQGLWQAVMGSNPAQFKNGADSPVEKVSWNDCQEFIARLNQWTGGGFRLPSEAEWEYACRAGAAGVPGGGREETAWYRDNSGGRTHPVAGKKPNAWGLHDMLGNVLEWCQDWFAEDYYSRSPASNPRGPENGSYRVVRGSGWRSSAEGVCPTIRIQSAPNYSFNTIGLRLAR
jgi:formylglycine-generating enzyme required for sulfatase activity